MIANKCVEMYVENFNYEFITAESTKEKKVFIKKTINGNIFLESYDASKYVDFYHNDQKKSYRKGDLAICVLENTPATWEGEIHE